MKLKFVLTSLLLLAILSSGCIRGKLVGTQPEPKNPATGEELCTGTLIVMGLVILMALALVLFMHRVTKS